MKPSRLSRKRSSSTPNQTKISSFFQKSPASAKADASSPFTCIKAKESSASPKVDRVPIFNSPMNGDGGDDDCIPDTPVGERWKQESQDVGKIYAVSSDSDVDVIPPTPQSPIFRKRKVLSNSINICQRLIHGDDVIPDTPPDKMIRKSQYFGNASDCRVSSPSRRYRPRLSLHKCLKRMSPANKNGDAFSMDLKENTNLTKLKTVNHKCIAEEVCSLLDSGCDENDAEVARLLVAKVKSNHSSNTNENSLRLIEDVNLLDSSLNLDFPTTPTSVLSQIEDCSLLRVDESPNINTEPSCRVIHLNPEAEKKDVVLKNDTINKDNSSLTTNQNDSLTSVSGCNLPNSCPDLHQCNSSKIFPVTSVPDSEAAKEVLHLGKRQTEILDNKCLKNTVEVHSLVKDYNRHIVENISCCLNEKQLLIKSELDGMTRTCVLKGFWAETQVRIGDIVNVLADFDEHQVAVIDSGHNLLIVNPDHLVSSTTVTAAVFCRRKAILQEWFRGLDGGNVVMLVGIIIHQVFQLATNRRISSKFQIIELINELLKKPSNLEEMFKLESQCSESDLRQKLEEYVEPISKCIKDCMSVSTLTDGSDKISSGRANDTVKDNIKLLEIRDIEENIWSPRFGLKGKIDLTVDVKIVSQTGVPTRRILPLELKTGRPSFSADHQGQVMLYNLMSKDRRPESDGGLLLYLRTGELREIPSKIHSEQGLVQLRNELVGHLTRPLNQSGAMQTEEQNGCIKMDHRLAPLPEPLCNATICSSCPYLLTCSVLHKTSDRANNESPSFERLSQTAMSHLQQDEVNYFIKWCCCLFLEDAFQKMNNRLHMRNIWCSSSKDREIAGDCYSDMMLAEIVEEYKIKNLHRFKRCPGHWNSKPLTSIGLLESQSVVISDEKWKLVALASGYVVSVTDSCVEVILDRNLHIKPEFQETVFRIDACSTQSTTTICLSSLARLMSRDPQCSALRKVVIHCPLPTMEDVTVTKQMSEFDQILSELSPDQVKAVRTSLLAQDYLLIKGMPGCGKTSTIVAMICIFSMVLKKTVLLASYTHMAVDNVLLKLKKMNIKFLRLGKSANVDSRLLAHTAEYLLQDVSSLDDMKLLFKTPIVATTCSGSNHVIFKSKRQFDVCIVDEASQVSQPVVLGMLFNCKKFVLVGDSHQLPPIVQCPEARRMGMQESLFCRLEVKHPEAAVKLSKQYRMNKAVMKLSNTLTYGSQMSHELESIANAVLELPNVERAISEMVMETDLWLLDVGSTELVKSVLFLNTDGLVPLRTNYVHGNEKICNETECHIACSVVFFLNKAGLKYADIGVISPYRVQVALLKQFLWKQQMQHSSSDRFDDLEVNTIDKYQGRDKDAIVISFVKNSSSNREEDEIIHDERRINVAITRARKKMIIIGSMETLRRYQPVKNLIDILKDEQKINLCEKKCSLKFVASEPSLGDAK